MGVVTSMFLDVLVAQSGTRDPGESFMMWSCYLYQASDYVQDPSATVQDEDNVGLRSEDAGPSKGSGLKGY